MYILAIAAVFAAGVFSGKMRANGLSWNEIANAFVGKVKARARSVLESLRSMFTKC